MNSKNYSNPPRFPVPLGRISAVQIINASCIIFLNLLPAFMILFLIGENLGSYTLWSDFSLFTSIAFAAAVLIDSGMYLYAMGDAKRSAAKFISESNPRDLVESEMAESDHPGDLAVKLTSEYLKAKTGIGIGFAFVNFFIIGLLLVDATYLNVVYSLFCFVLTALNFPTPGRVRRWILKTLLRNRKVLESEISSNQRAESKPAH